MPHLALQALAWLLYALLHSLMASSWAKRTIKQNFPRVFPRYRVLFNLVAIVTLALPLYAASLYPSDLLWHWTGWAKYTADIIALLGVLGFAISMRYYDAASFLGIRANNEGNIGAGDAPFVISPMHRFVRHPWYFFALLIIWSRDMSSSSLVTALMITGYFLIGSRLEETKLVVELGDAYANYRSKVGGIVPLPWRHLSVSEADAIAHGADVASDCR